MLQMKNRRLLQFSLFLGVLYGIFLSVSIDACTTVLVGKNASVDGSTMIARSEDLNTAWSKHFVVRKENTNPSHFVSKGNGFTLDLPKEQLKYTATPEWDTSEGLFEEDGINSKNVAMSATESATTKEEILKKDPYTAHGIAEDSMLTVTLPYIDSARAGVERLGKIVAKQGAAETNGVIFSDKNEIWYMEILSGHQWAAVKVPDDCYAVIPNMLSIDSFDLKDKDSYLCSADLESFLEKNQLINTKRDISLRDIFADKSKDEKYNLPRIWDAQRKLTPSKKQKITDRSFEMFVKPDKPISIAETAYIMTLHFNGTEYDTIEGTKPDKYRPISVPNTMESHILQIRNNVPEEISGIHWLALGIPDTSNYIPFYSNISETPEAYQKGTDMPDDISAYWTYRLTNILTKPYYSDFKKNITLPTRQKVRDHLSKELASTDQQARELIVNHPEKLTDYLNQKTQSFADYAIDAYQKMNQELIVKMSEKTATHHDKDL